MPIASIISTAIPAAVLVSHIALGLLVLAFIWRDEAVKDFLRRHGLVIGLLISLATVAGSLFYSSVLGYPPCLLCWWQRVFLFPTLVLFAVALYKKDKRVFSYILPLAALALVVALYQTYTDFGGTSLLACTDTDGDCSKIFVKEFGYITIPVMGLTSAAYLILLSLVNRRHE